MAPCAAGSSLQACRRINDAMGQHVAAEVIKLIPALSTAGQYNALVIAVAHDEVKQLGTHGQRGLSQEALPPMKSRTCLATTRFMDGSKSDRGNLT